MDIFGTIGALPKGIRGIFISIRKTKRSPEQDEDKYGHMAMLKKLNDEYRCKKCGDFLVYGDDGYKTLVCLKCGFQKPAPPIETKNKGR